jgi:two-component system, cell cycle response regulator
MKNPRVLLVEDDPVQAKIAREFLESALYDVLVVQNGKAAIKTAKTEHVDIILLDLVLPDMEGNEVCRWLKTDSATIGIPIIMLTVRNSTREKVEGLNAGADDYLPKPYSEIELNARIYACLRTKGLQDELAKKNRELKELLAKVELLAITDPLTRLFNRRHFEIVMEKEFGRSERFRSPLSCLMIDVDHFKSINDSKGHGTGDTVLKELAVIIKNCVRKIDTASRWGGEEFIVVLPEARKLDAVNIASRIVKAIGAFPFNGLDDAVTVSIGVASIPEQSITTPEQLINAADTALYEAKLKGRNRIESGLATPD